MLGTLFANKYKITKKLGEGGMGTVYQATQTPIDRLVAIKVLLGKLAQDEVAVKRFELEARAVSKMQHPNTVTIFDYGTTDDDRLYIVMEFLRGKTLSDALRATGVGLDERRVIHIVRQVCSSLGDAHAAGIIHRDLKPDNIFLTETGGSKDWVKVLDFGVAKMADSEGASTLTQTGMIFGTPKYMSPEQAEGKPIDFRADIYAIGVVMYEMLTGRPPFLADTPVALLLKHIQEKPKAFRVLRPDLTLSPEIEMVTMKALAKDPDHRYARVEEMAADLEACLGFVGTGQQRVVETSTQQNQVTSKPTPTEVNPNQGGPGSDLSLRPPNALPSGLSLGLMDVRRAQTEPAPPMNSSPTGATGAAPAPFSLHYRPDPATMGMNAGVGPMSATGPISAGSGPETLGGGVGDLDLSRGLRATDKPKLPMALIGGGVVAALGLIGFLVTRPTDDGSATSRPLDSPSPKPSATAVATPEPTPTLAPVTPTPTPTLAASPVPSPTRTPGGRPSPTPVASVSAEPKAPRVALRFESNPSGAIVQMSSGEQLGRTPFEKEFLKGNDMLRVTFTLTGHKSAEEIFTLSANRTIRGELAPEPVVATPAPSLRASPAATPAASVRASPAATPTTDDKVDELK